MLAVGGWLRKKTRLYIKEVLFEEMCILRWSQQAVQPSGWCLTYKAKEQNF